MSAQYKRFLKLLEKWPVDKTKTGRDLGEHLRQQLKLTLGSSNITTVAGNENIDKQIDSLDRLSKNIYAEKYPRTFNSTVSGLTAEQCNQILSSEFLRYLKEQDAK